MLAMPTTLNVYVIPGFPGLNYGKQLYLKYPRNEAIADNWYTLYHCKVTADDWYRCQGTADNTGINPKSLQITGILLVALDLIRN